MDQETTVQNDVGSLVFGLVLLIVALCIWIVLSFTQRRTHKWPDCCWGLPGVVDPVNFLNPTHRLMAALAFGAMSSGFIYNMIVSPAPDVSNFYTSVFVRFSYLVLFVLLTALLYYPFFACMDAPVSLVGYCMGSFYCDLYIVYIFYSLANQLRDIASPLMKASYYMMLVPRLVCIGTVLVWFHYMMVREVKFICSMGQFWKLALIEKRERENPYHLHVKKLLSKHEERSWPCMRGFKYPFPFLVAMVLSIVIIFELTIVFAVYVAIIADSFGFSVDADPVRIPYAVLVVSFIVSAGIVIAMLIHLAYIMRKHMKEIYISAKHVVVDIHLVKWPTFTVVSSIRYAGVQITAVIIAWFLYWIVCTIIGLTIIGLSYFPDCVGRILYTLFMTVLFAAAMYGAQVFVTWMFFVSDERDVSNSIVIKNRRVFNSFTYIVLLYNILTGLVFTVLRLVIAIGITCLMLVRLDQPLVLKGWGLLDFGHKTYKKFIIMEILLGNPIVHVFVQSLVEANRNKLTTGAVTKHRISKKAYNRWMVAYTLVRNTQLQTLTASQLHSKPDLND